MCVSTQQLCDVWEDCRAGLVRMVIGWLFMVRTGCWAGARSCLGCWNHGLLASLTGSLGVTRGAVEAKSSPGGTGGRCVAQTGSFLKDTARPYLNECWPRKRR